MRLYSLGDVTSQILCDLLFESRRIHVLAQMRPNSGTEIVRAGTFAVVKGATGARGRFGKRGQKRLSFRRTGRSRSGTLGDDAARLGLFRNCSGLRRGSFRDRLLRLSSRYLLQKNFNFVADFVSALTLLRLLRSPLLRSRRLWLVLAADEIHERSENRQYDDDQTDDFTEIDRGQEQIHGDVS